MNRAHNQQTLHSQCARTDPQLERPHVCESARFSRRLLADDDGELLVRASAVLKSQGHRTLVPWETRCRRLLARGCDGTRPLAPPLPYCQAPECQRQ
jgi:hypothetical protein